MRTRVGLGRLAAVVALVSSVGLPVEAGAQSDPAPADPGAASQALVQSLDAQTEGELAVDRDRATGAVTFIGTEAGKPLATGTETGGDPSAAATRFAADYGALFGADHPGDLERVSAEPRVDGGAAVLFRQVVDDVPVLGGELRVQVDEHGDVLSALGELQPHIAVTETASVAPTSAAEAAVDATAKAHGVDAATLTASGPEQWIYAPDLLGAPAVRGPRLVWRVEVAGAEDGEPIRELVLIDATTGGVALHFSQIASGLSRVVCDNANIAASSPCNFGAARVEGQGPTGSADVDAAYELTGKFYDYLSSRFNRDSVNGRGLELRSTVRHCPITEGCPWPNAQWVGTQVVFGQGFSRADDIVGHEFTHGVTNYTSHLFYYMQSGAINESLSDVFGELFDLSNGYGNDEPSVRWEIGEDLAGGSIRDMADPTAFGDPDATDSTLYAVGADVDQGGVHTNSGVNNKAAFLMVDGGTFHNRTVIGLGIDKVARIYYEAATTMLTSGSDYADLGRALIQACGNLIGVEFISLTDCRNVDEAVRAVEMPLAPTRAPTYEAPVGCDAGETPFTVFSDDLESALSGNWTVGGTPGRRWAYPSNPNPLGIDATYATSGLQNFFAADTALTSDTTISRTTDVTLPPGSALLFNHAYEYEQNFDGGTVEYSTDHGATWQDAAPLFTSNPYNGAVAAGTRPAFTGSSNGYYSSRINLGGLVGQPFRFRFRSTTDASGAAMGWFIDDIRIISCGAPAGLPDAQIRPPGSSHFFGNDVYNTQGTDQTVTTTVTSGRTRVVRTRIQNDSSGPDQVVVVGTRSNDLFNVRYITSTSANITASVSDGTYALDLAPGEKAIIDVYVTARSGSRVGSTGTVKLRASSSRTPTARDTVKVKLTRTA